MMKLVAGLDSAQLLTQMRALVDRGNAVEADLLAHLGEVDARRLYLEEACPSMFVYCVQVLHFAEGVAYKRIQAARAARCHPEILEAVRGGDLHLTAVGLLAPKLTKENCAALLEAARHRSAEEIKRLLADREPPPAPPTFARRIAEPRLPRTTQVALPKVALAVQAPAAFVHPAPKPTEPLGAERYRVQFVADGETNAQLQELRALMRHQIPDGDVGKILARAIAVLLEQVRKQKFADSRNPRPDRPVSSPNEVCSRHIPAAIRRTVWERDGSRCTYTAADGRRCDSREFVEFDHIQAWTRARSHSIDGITLRCRAHNQQRARIDFGERHMARFGRQAGPSTGFDSSSLQR